MTLMYQYCSCQPTPSTHKPCSHNIRLVLAVIVSLFLLGSIANNCISKAARGGLAGYNGQGHAGQILWSLAGGSKKCACACNGSSGAHVEITCHRSGCPARVEGRAHANVVLFDMEGLDLGHETPPATGPVYRSHPQSSVRPPVVSFLDIAIYMYMYICMHMYICMCMYICIYIAISDIWVWGMLL